MAKHVTKLEDVHLVAVCHAFLEGTSATEIAAALTKRLAREGLHLRVNREQVYPLLRQAAARGLLAVHAPLEHRLHERIADVFHWNPAHIDVVAVRERLMVNHHESSRDSGGDDRSHHRAERGSLAGDLVASRAAEVCLHIVRGLGREGKKVVHIGLGAGATTLSIAQHLAQLLRANEGWPDIVLHALTPGFYVDNPQMSPVAFFGLFREFGARVGYVGLFAPPVVLARDYAKMVGQMGIEEAFRRKDDIDLVVTSLASREDPHGDMNRFLAEDQRGREMLGRHDWVGDVAYRPYSAKGPILQKTPARAVTLFELSELVDHAAQPGKHVVLASGPCGVCGRPRGDALLPLLENPSLKLWTHLVMDLATAEWLMNQRGSGL